LQSDLDTLSLGSLEGLSMRRVLILSCSERKRPDFELLPAIERYDGPTFRVLRRYLIDLPLDPPEVHILSAEFGLIPVYQPIPNYDRRMTTMRARQLRTSVQRSLAATLDGLADNCLAPEQLLVCLGRTYRETLAEYAGPAAETLPERCIRAGQGKRLTLLRNWLRGGQAAL
jgi:hypothetical protein